MTLQDFYTKLQKHDWYYQFSDDHSVWQRGEAESVEISNIAKQSPEHEKLYKAFCAHYFSGDAWKTPKAPYPEKPV